MLIIEIDEELVIAQNLIHSLVSQSNNTIAFVSAESGKKITDFVQLNNEKNLDSLVDLNLAESQSKPLNRIHFVVDEFNVQQAKPLIQFF